MRSLAIAALAAALAVGIDPVSVGHPVPARETVAGTVELAAEGAGASPGFELLVPRTAHADPRDLCVATVPIGKRPGEANRTCDVRVRGRATVFVTRPGVAATVVAGIAPAGVARVELDGHRLPLSSQRAFLALLARGRPRLVEVDAAGERRRLVARRHRRPGAVFGDEIGENILIRTRAQVIARFGAPAAARAGCDYYEVVGDDTRFGWRLCYRGETMTGASGYSRIP